MTEAPSIAEKARRAGATLPQPVKEHPGEQHSATAGSEGHAEDRGRPLATDPAREEGSGRTSAGEPVRLDSSRRQEPVGDPERNQFKIWIRWIIELSYLDHDPDRYPRAVDAAKRASPRQWRSLLRKLRVFVIDVVLRWGHVGREVRPAVPTMARTLGLADNTVRTLLAVAVDAGILRQVRKGTPWRAATYQLREFWEDNDPHEAQDGAEDGAEDGLSPQNSASGPSKLPAVLNPTLHTERQRA